MSDPTGGTVAYEGDAKLFEDIGSTIPETPEPVTPPASAEGAPAPAEAPEAPAPSEARPRDDKGRFAPKDVAAPPAPAASPEPEAAPAAAAPATAPPSPDAPAAPDITQYPAYEYKVNGQATPFKGALRGSDGVLFPNAVLPNLERLLAQAHQAHQIQSQTGRVVADLKQQIAAAQEEKAVVLQRLSDIMTDPAKFEAWANDTRGNWDKLILEAKLQMAEKDRDSRVKQFEEQASEQEVQALLPLLHSSVQETIQHLVGQDEFKDLAFDAEWQSEFKKRLMESHFERLFTEATEQEVQAGIAQQVGQTVFHPEPILAEMRFQAGFARKELARNKALADAAARNARTAAPSAVVPTAGAKPQGTPSAKPKPALKDGMSKQDVDRLVFETLMDE